jgi:UDP-N-acetylglucosamine 2-epimerase
VTIRNGTEWRETVADGWNFLAGSDTGRIIAEFKRAMNTVFGKQLSHYGEGNAAELIIEYLSSADFKTLSR